jgi:methylmalonyl-CoA/ethylmalonyl-CoA epimerase
MNFTKREVKMSHHIEAPRVESIREVAIAVEDVKEVVALYEDLFDLKFALKWSMPGENMNVKAAKIGGTQLQIVESTSPEGVIAKFIRSKGEGLNHICFGVTDLQGMIARLKEKGVRLVPEEPVISPRGTYIFVHPKFTHGVLIELMEHEG